MLEEKVIRKILIIIALVMLIISISGLYMALNAVIDIWLGYKYSPIYKALLNLAVLILSIYVLKLLLSHEHKSKNTEGTPKEE